MKIKPPALQYQRQRVVLLPKQLRENCQRGDKGKDESTEDRYPIAQVGDDEDQRHAPGEKAEGFREIGDWNVTGLQTQEYQECSVKGEAAADHSQGQSHKYRAFPAKTENRMKKPQAI